MGMIFLMSGVTLEVRTQGLQPRTRAALTCPVFGPSCGQMAQRGTYAFAEISTVVQVHMISMFAPSLVTGHVVKRFGVPRVAAAVRTQGLQPWTGVLL